MTSRPGATLSEEWIQTDSNKPLWPYSNSGYNSWKSRSVEEIRVALSNKVSHQAAGLQERLLKSSVRVDSKKFGAV